MTQAPVRLILASSSPARLQTLRRAGLHPEVIVSGADEDSITRPTATGLVAALAELKGTTVADRLPTDEDWALVACDSMLELAGQRFGKPGSEAAAIERWHAMRGHTGTLHTGHHVIVHRAGRGPASATRVGSTRVTFADLTDAEIAAYAATGEPERVAGSFTIDGFGGAFVTRIDGDPHNVVGISLPLVRQMLLDLGVEWTELWTPAPGSAFTG